MHSYQNNHTDAERVPFIDSKLADFDTSGRQWHVWDTWDAPKCHCLFCAHNGDMNMWFDMKQSVSF